MSRTVTKEEKTSAFVEFTTPLERDNIQNENESVKSLNHVQLFATPWAVACQAPLSMEFSKQEYWGGLLLPSPGYIPDPGIEPGFAVLQADFLLSEPQTAF